MNTQPAHMTSTELTVHLEDACNFRKDDDERSIRQSCTLQIIAQCVGRSLWSRLYPVRRAFAHEHQQLQALRTHLKRIP